MREARDPAAGLAAGTDAEAGAPPQSDLPGGGTPEEGSSGSRPALSLAREAADAIRREVERAHGREVCFMARVEADGTVREPRAVARGNREAVLAAARDAPEGSLAIHNHPSGVLEPSAADLTVAERLYQEGHGTAITDNGARSLYVVVEPPEPRRITSLDPTALEGLLAPDGALATVHGGFEDRPGQRRMLRTVAERYNEDGGVAMVEAGTGTGKSLAYLLPAASWALLNGERTVVSTATINLQEQLATKDLPLVRSLLADAPPEVTGPEGRQLQWSLVKGRGNYVSIRRARLAAETANDLFGDDRSEELQNLLEWIERTEDGSLADLPEPPSSEVWEEVKSDTDICLRTRCPHFQQCFFQRARREAAGADVLVANHHLVFSDLSVRRAADNHTGPAVLPAYRHLVLDEAHNVEDAATSHLSVEVSRRGLFRTLSRLDRRGKGVFAAVAGTLRGGGEAEGDELARRVEDRGVPAAADARRALDALMDALEPLAPEARGEPRRIARPDESAPTEDPALADALAATVSDLERLRREVAGLREGIEASAEWRDRLEGRLLDLRSAERRLDGAVHALRLVLEPAQEEEVPHVRWIERRDERGNLALSAAPVEPGGILREDLFGRRETSVLTSATLTTRGRFDFVRGRLGLMEGTAGEEGGGEEAPGPEEAGDDPESHDGGLLPVTEELVPSPFDFSSQTVLCVPTDLPPPSAGEDFDRATAVRVGDFAGITDGGLFVLFTSYRSLRRVAAELRKAGADRRWPLLVHGEEPRTRLLQSFRESGRALLLGTASFWEGVDVPGRTLRGLVLQKLPFRVPSEPLTEAREEVLDRRGRNPFHHYALPLAALRLKQGFGRLVRSRTDRGAVLLLDDRIVSRPYGRYLRESLPAPPLVQGSWSEARDALLRFYADD